MPVGTEALECQLNVFIVLETCVVVSGDCIWGQQLIYIYCTVLYSYQTYQFNRLAYYRIFRPIARALSIQKRSEIVKNEHARYTLEKFPTDNAHVICTKKRYWKIRYLIR
jgi:hypothetical protein